jgi:hypothetical protein
MSLIVVLSGGICPEVVNPRGAAMGIDLDFGFEPSIVPICLPSSLTAFI